MGPFGAEVRSTGNHHFVSFAQRRLLPRLTIDRPQVLEGTPSGGRGHWFIIVVADPMGHAPHTDVAPLTVECADPLASHRLKRRLDAIRGGPLES